MLALVKFASFNFGKSNKKHIKIFSRYNTNNLVRWAAFRGWPIFVVLTDLGCADFGIAGLMMTWSAQASDVC
jgi:hypothetical protein